MRSAVSTLFIKSGKIAATLASMSIVALVTGCVPSDTHEAHATRVSLYASEEALAADSSLIVVGDVDNQVVKQDLDGGLDFTLSTIRISDVVKGSNRFHVGDTVVVRQHGSDEQPPPGPILDAEGTFLLYLTPSGLGGKLGAQFYITGATAGVYESATGGAQSRSVTAADDSFVRFDPESGDSLPDVINGVEEVSG